MKLYVGVANNCSLPNQATKWDCLFYLSSSKFSHTKKINK